MQNNVAICVIILVTLGVIVVSWMAFRCWKKRFKRELLVSYHTGKQHIPVRELATVQAPSTSTSSSGGPVERIERPARGKKERVRRESPAESLATTTRQTRGDANRRRKITTAAPPPPAPAPPLHDSTPTSMNTNIRQEKGKQRDEWAQPADNPAPAIEQSSPSAPATTSASNVGTSSEWGQPATQSEQSQGKWSSTGQDATAKPEW